MHSVIVWDEEYQKNANIVSNTCDDLDKIVSVYLGLMEKISGDALISGDTAFAFQVYREYAEKLKGVLSALAEQHTRTNDNFLREIDIADDYLF